MSSIRAVTDLLLEFAVIAVIAAVFNAFAYTADVILAIPPWSRPPLDAHLFLSALSAAVGLFWVLWASSYLHSIGGGSAVSIRVLGLRPTEQLVTAGPYAYTRHPTLLGILFLLLAVALLTRSISALFLLPIAALIALEYMRRYEEPALRARFGRDYRQYRRMVPALIPRPRRHGP